MDEIDWVNLLDDGKPHPAGNYFNVDSPQAYACYLRGFAIGHSQLKIHAYSAEQARSFDLDFADVQYISAPVRWHGVQFRLGTSDECLQLRRKLGIGTAYPDSEVAMSQLYKLFLLDLPNDITV